MRSPPQLEIIRPINDVMIGLGVIAGYLVGGGVHWMTGLEGFLVGFLISGFSMVTNDIFDVETDTLNLRMRPLVRGDMSVRQAWSLALVMMLVGLSISALTGPYTLSIAALFTLLSYAYNRTLKKTGMPGTIIVALSMAIPFLYGGLLASMNGILVGVMFMCSFMAGLSREIVKTVADIEGDRATGVKSLPVVAGIRPSALMSAGLILAAIALSYLPVFYGCTPYYVTGITIADIIFLFITGKVITMRGSEDAYRLKRAMLLPMGIALITFIVEGIV